MHSDFHALLAAFSEYLSSHDFVEIERRKSKWAEEACFRSQAVDLKIGTALGRGDVHVEAKPVSSDENWYQIPIILSIVAADGNGDAPKFWELQNAALLARQMEDCHQKVIAFFNLDGSDRVNKYSIWLEGSYWGGVLRSRAERYATSSSKPWWKFW